MHICVRTGRHVLVCQSMHVNVGCCLFVWMELRFFLCAAKSDSDNHFFIDFTMYIGALSSRIKGFKAKPENTTEQVHWEHGVSA